MQQNKQMKKIFFTIILIFVTYFYWDFCLRFFSILNLFLSISVCLFWVFFLGGGDYFTLRPCTFFLSKEQRLFSLMIVSDTWTTPVYHCTPRKKKHVIDSKFRRRCQVSDQSRLPCSAHTWKLWKYHYRCCVSSAEGLLCNVDI